MRFSSSTKKRYFLFSEIQCRTFTAWNNKVKIRANRVYLEFFMIFWKLAFVRNCAYSSFIFLTVVLLISGTSLCSGVFNGNHRIVQSFFNTVVYFYSFKAWKCSRARWILSDTPESAGLHYPHTKRLVNGSRMLQRVSKTWFWEEKLKVCFCFNFEFNDDLF